MDELEDFLKGEEQPEAAVEAEPGAEAPQAEAEQPETEAKAERPRGPDGKFIPKGEAEAPAPESASPAPETPPLEHPALIGERRRRQEAEDRLRTLEQQLQQMQQPQQPTTPPDRWEDPEGYDRWLMEQVTSAAEQRAIEAFNYQRIATAAAQFKADKPDYDDTIRVFGQMANVNPGLVQQMQASENPAKFAYDTAKQAIAINQAGSLEAYIQQEAARLAAERQPAPEPAPAPPVPDTLADAQSSRGSSAGAFTPTPLDDILGSAFR